MQNTDELKVKERADKVTNLKERLKHWERARDEAEEEAQKCRKELRELDMRDALARKKAAARKFMIMKTGKQDQIVAALRQIGKTTTAGPICAHLKKYYGLDIHNSKFAAAYIEFIKDDPRIIITKVNPTKNTYSLREWGGKK